MLKKIVCTLSVTAPSAVILFTGYILGFRPPLTRYELAASVIGVWVGVGASILSFVFCMMIEAKKRG